MRQDFVVYYKDDKEIVCVVEDIKEPTRFLLGNEFVGRYIDSDDYVITAKDGKAYFENLQEKILYLDDYRGRYEE